MLPNHILSAPSELGSFLFPRTAARRYAVDGLSDQHLGGVALNDSSQGLIVKTWMALIVGNDIVIEAPGVAPFTILTIPGVIWVALAFDQAMRAFVAYVTPTDAKYYWYDTSIAGYTTSTLPAGTTRVFASLDDNRPSQSSTSDIILSYVRAGVLYFRAQRDRYTVEYMLGPFVGKLIQAGMSTVNRYQFSGINES